MIDLDPAVPMVTTIIAMVAMLSVCHLSCDRSSFHNPHGYLYSRHRSQAVSHLIVM